MRSKRGLRFRLQFIRRNRPYGNAPHLRTAEREGAFMLDIVMLALGLGFFVVAVGYTYACERL
jgi:hypothetical protein